MPSSNNMLISIKSKIGVEFRRYALKSEEIKNFEKFQQKIQTIHQLEAIRIAIYYSDHEDDFLPINNDENLAKTIRFILSTNNNSNNDNNNHHNTTSGSNHNSYDFNNNNNLPLLKLFIGKEGDIPHNLSFNGKKKGHNFKGLSNLISPSNDHDGNRPSIGMPVDFRQVSSIIDADTLPKTCRRVRLVKRGSDKPLGFYIRDGTYKRFTPLGVEHVYGIFISRLVTGGLAESTGLLAVNDEILEVNGIEVTEGKTLDQVTDMMVANSSNLIITIRPASEHVKDNIKDAVSMHKSSPSNDQFQTHNHHLMQQQQQQQKLHLQQQQQPQLFQQKLQPHQLIQHNNKLIHQQHQQLQQIQLQPPHQLQQHHQHQPQIQLQPPPHQQHNYHNNHLYHQYQLHQPLLHQQQQRMQNQNLSHQYHHQSHHHQQLYPLMYSSRNQSTGSISDHEEDEIKEYLHGTS